MLKKTVLDQHERNVYDDRKNLLLAKLSNWKFQRNSILGPFEVHKEHITNALARIDKAIADGHTSTDDVFSTLSKVEEYFTVIDKA